MPKYTTKTVHYVDYGDLESEVSRPLGFEWSIVAAEELNNDSAWTCDADGSVSDSDVAKIEKAIEDGKEPRYGLHARQLLNWMVLSRFAPPGNYVVEICW